MSGLEGLVEGSNWRVERAGTHAFLYVPSGAVYSLLHEHTSPFAYLATLYREECKRLCTWKLPHTIISTQIADAEPRSMAILTHERTILQQLHTAAVQGVMPVYDDGLGAGSVGLLMPHLGQSLDSYIPNLPLASAIAADLCWIVNSINDSGVDHRDIKPDNIYLNKDAVPGSEGRVPKIILGDYGVSSSDKIPFPFETPSNTTPKRVWGTPGFMAPETWRGLAYSDVFAVGATLFNLATGELPVSGADGFAQIRGIQKAEFNWRLSRQEVKEYKPFIKTVRGLLHYDPFARLDLQSAEAAFAKFAESLPPFDFNQLR